MGISKSGIFNTVSSTLLLMLLLSAGLYTIAVNPKLAGFDVQASDTQARNFSSATPKVPNVSLITNKSYSSASQQPACLNWYKTRKGDTQWGLAKRYSENTNKWPWIKGMRKASGKALKDDALKANEVVCIDWQS